MLGPEQVQAAAVLELRRRRRKAAAEVSAVARAGWRAWLARWFPQATSKPFAPRHERLWSWLDALRPGERPETAGVVEVWPRGGGKSSTAELGVTYVGSQFRRRFALYVCATQGQANKHVATIARHFETLGMGRATGPYGNSLGWRIDLLRVEGGFNVLALGLDAAARGVKLDDFRPDLIILDDIDERLDTQKSVEKKITTLTETLLPTGSPDCAVLVIQNLIHADSVVAQLADRRADFLHGATVYQEPALVDYDQKQHLVADAQPDGTRRYRITGGTPTWLGQDLETVTHQVNLWGRAAFHREAQHDLTEVDGGLWNRKRDIEEYRLPRPAQLLRIVVAVDPNTEGGEGNDEAGIMVVGSLRHGAQVHGYLLEDATVPGGPMQWAEAAVDAYHRWKANTLVAEKNNGGQMVAITIGTVPKAPHVKLVTASRGKLTRAEPVQALAEEGRLHHVGVFVELERELCTWRPGEPSPNRLDAYVWGMTELLLGETHLAPWFPGQKKPENGHVNGNGGRVLVHR